MKICFLHRWFPPNEGGIGGIVPYIVTMADALRQAGHEVYVFTEATPKTSVGLTHERGLTVFRMPKPNRLRDVWGEISQVRAIASELRRFVVRHGIDVVETCDWGSETFFFRKIKPRSVRVALKLHCPLAVSSRALGRKPRVRGRLYSWMERRCIQEADVVLSPSRLCAEATGRALSLDASGFQVVPNPINTARWRPAPDPPKHKRLLYAGRLECGKGMDRLAAPINQVLHRHPDAEVRFVGSDSADAPGRGLVSVFLRQSVSPDLHDRMQFVGPMPPEELAVEYQQAYACWFPSRFESFSLVCAEAMACGVPVVGSQNTGMAEIIEHGRSGFVTDFEDPDEVCTQVTQLLETPALRHAMGREARTRIETHFSQGVVARRWEEALA